MFLLRTFRSAYADLQTQVRKLREDDAILIYQMGKVGSTAFERSLPNALHFHTLYNHPHCPFRARVKWGWFGVHLLLPLAYWLKRTLIRSRHKVRIITMVREPVARARSVFFQELPHWLVLYFSRHATDERMEGIDLLRDVFADVFNFGYYDSWFDRELQRFTGIDVFANNFDAEKGYMVLRQGKYEVLVLRFEDMERLSDEIERFVGTPVSLTRENISSKKWYGPLMKEFHALDVDDLRQVQALRNSRTARFFGYQQ